MKFEGIELPDYRDDPVNYELEELARPDEVAMLERVQEIALVEVKRRDKSIVVDFCCGTGLSMENLVGHPNIETIFGIDSSEPFLEFAKNKFKDHQNPPVFLLGDAVDHPLPVAKVDLAILASAYHHIENVRKVAFLKRVRDNLSFDGFAFVAENILPDYDVNDEESYKQAISLFYDHVLDTATQLNPNLPDLVKDLILRVAKYGHDGDYEYKTSLLIFMKDVEAAGLIIRSQELVWPSSAIGCGGGNYVFVLARR